MKPLEEIYGGRFFCRRNSLNWRAKYVCEAIYGILRPCSVIDVGCAIGDLVKEFLVTGIDAYGLEGSTACLPYLEVERERIFIEDLRLPCGSGFQPRNPGLKAPPIYDLAICFEVAEHIEPEHADQFLDNLAGLSDRILMSAAPPGQGGHYHVNCQPMEYWEGKFRARGYLPGPDVVNALKRALAPWRKKPGIKAYYQNMAYFEKVR